MSFKRKGFTLVELILGIALMGLLSGVLGFSLFQGVKAFDLITSRRSALAQARLAMDRMVKEISLIESSSDVINVSSNTQFIFEYPNNTQITYALAGGDSVTRNSDLLARNVSSLTFTYLDANGNATVVAANVRSVRIQMTLAAAHNQGTFTLRTQTYLRNTGNHYDLFQ